jgi:hypothetical protein
MDSCQCVSGELDNGRTGLRFTCSDACTIPEAGPDGTDAAEVGDAAEGGDASEDAHLIDAHSAADTGQADGAAPSDGSAADVTAQ